MASWTSRLRREARRKAAITWRVRCIHAATALEAHARRRSARRHAASRRMRRDAATTVQRVCRGSLARALAARQHNAYSYKDVDILLFINQHLL